MGLFNREKREITDFESIANCIKKMTEKDMFFLEFEEGEASLFESKLGGVPYWTSGESFPVGSDGNYMSLLLQLEFNGGLLQFFISNNSTGGLNYDNAEDQSGFKIVFHKTVDKSITESDVLKLGMPLMPMDDDTFSPVRKEARVKLTAGKDYIKPSNYNFNNYFKKAVLELTGEDIKDAIPYDYFGEEKAERFYSLFEEGKSKLYGYPSFTQEDSRTFVGDMDYYNTLLLQLDSDLKSGILMWGDSGEANFIINEKALEELDFSRVLYNWDCF
ncbi:MAG: DUF1963 domain-containing protein [Eubacterium sp.]|nr:DUF1963 domain-containing protein [Eubacterium sp.]